MSPTPRQKFRSGEGDSDRRLRTRLDILIALMMLQIILSIGLWVDRPRQDQMPSETFEEYEVKDQIPAADDFEESTSTLSEEVDLAELDQIDEIEKIDWSTLKIDVLNGCGIAGIARKSEQWLVKNGYRVRITENADRHDYAISFLQDRSGHLDAAIELAEALNLSLDQIQELKGTPSPYTDLTLVIGKDYKRLSFAK